MKTSLLDSFNLNDEQLEAANAIRGAVEIVAGPGTGKTHTLVARACRLIETGVKPSRICIVTFTNKAATELKERVAARMGDAGKGLCATTFHGLGLRLLYWTMAAHGDTKFPVILDEDDSARLLKNHLIEVRPDLYNPQIKIRYNTLIERYNMRREGGYPTHQTSLSGTGLTSKAVYAEMMVEYEKAKNRTHAFDFADLLYCCVNSPYRQMMRFRFSHVMVDEAHDMNRIQLEMARMLAGKNLCIIYDEDQSIYEWRGANPKNLEIYRRRYPNHRRIILTKNYRCSTQIIEKSTNLIRRNKKRVDKQLVSIPGNGPQPIFRRFVNADREAAWIAETIQEHNNNGIAYEDMAVLYRANQQSLILERELHNYGIPIKIQDGRSLFTRPSVKIFLAYVTVCIDPHCDLAFEKILNEPSRGIGEKTLLVLKKQQAIHKMSLWDVISNSKIRTALLIPGSTRKNIEALVTALERPINIMMSSKNHCTSVPYEIDKATAIVRAIRTLYTNELAPRERTIVQTIQDDFRSAIRKNTSVVEWIFNAQLSSSGDGCAEDGSVNLYTMHASKGLEFEVVFVTGLEHGICPWNKGRVDQERKLTYVAMTRAKTHLFLSAAGQRFLNGTVVRYSQSQFVNESFTPYAGEPHAKLSTVANATAKV